MREESYSFKPIAFVSNNRKDVVDDDWGNVISTITCIDTLPDASLIGLEDFSHVDILFMMHKVKRKKVIYGARHPRNNESFPKVGIFSQRAKNRPNPIGHTTCKLLKVDKNKLIVQGLDAIDGTPVLDIKPYMKQFAPKTEVMQPLWVDAIMSRYF